MKLIGLPLRRPNFNEITAAAVMAAGLWVLAVGLMKVAQVQLAKGDAGALLVVMLWACLSARIGIRIDQGGRHLAANVVVSGLLLGVYEVLRTLF